MKYMDYFNTAAYGKSRNLISTFPGNGNNRLFPNSIVHSMDLGISEKFHSSSELEIHHFENFKNIMNSDVEVEPVAHGDLSLQVELDAKLVGATSGSPGTTSATSENFRNSEHSSLFMPSRSEAMIPPSLPMKCRYGIIPNFQLDKSEALCPPMLVEKGSMNFSNALRVGRPPAGQKWFTAHEPVNHLNGTSLFSNNSFLNKNSTLNLNKNKFLALDKTKNINLNKNNKFLDLNNTIHFDAALDKIKMSSRPSNKLMFNHNEHSTKVESSLDMDISLNKNKCLDSYKISHFDKHNKLNLNLDKKSNLSENSNKPFNFNKNKMNNINKIKIFNKVHYKHNQNSVMEVLNVPLNMNKASKPNNYNKLDIIEDKILNPFNLNPIFGKSHKSFDHLNGIESDAFLTVEGPNNLSENKYSDSFKGKILGHNSLTSEFVDMKHSLHKIKNKFDKIKINNIIDIKNGNSQNINECMFINRNVSKHNILINNTNLLNFNNNINIGLRSKEIDINQYNGKQVELQGQVVDFNNNKYIIEINHIL